MKDCITYIKLWIWFFIFGLVESATVFQSPIKLWWLVLIINFILSIIMVSGEKN